jgi:hypothetical protein
MLPLVGMLLRLLAKHHPPRRTLGELRRRRVAMQSEPIMRVDQRRFPPEQLYD